MTRQYGIRAFANNSALVAESDVIILAVKPQIMAPVLREIAAAVDGTKLIISLAAGVATRTLREQLERRPTEVLRKAVKGMLPRNRLARQQINKLKIYAGPVHPHEAQAPKTLEVS